MTNTSSVNPSEVGWQFVPQYYTFVNKHPNRLHCFYTKESTFIHGTEGEDGTPCFGQQEIHNKITSIGFQDCKVFIHSVDAQSSANGGIIIQVIGEMSNKGEAWRKFVQTFFLAEQPNGYYVLNDIFRFLKEESVEEGEELEEEAPLVSVPSSPTPPPVEPEPVPTPTPAAVPPVEESAPSPVPSPPPQPQVNGHTPEVEVEPTPAVAEPSPVSSPEPTPAASPAPPPSVSPAPPPSQPPVAAAPQQPQQPPSQPQAPAAPAPAPAPLAPKSWASLAATGAKSWGSAVASTRGTSEAPAPSSVSPSPMSGPHSPAPHVGRPMPRQDAQHPAYVAAQNVATPQCFVKSVTENVSDQALRATITARFGPIKELEIVRSKACAFLEFQQLDAAKRAILTSLPMAQGGEGGIRIETDGGAGQARIIVETRKERGDRPPPRAPPMNGDRGRGGFRGRGGSGARGRGGPPPKQ
ncbi:uncharacterized protein BXZ73DRAFT_41982 [Epithele typhae]|uniref:uncharacterized protein n=1 Tax=Epithele typhae TaxID=378194 RepID=UPI0020078479|nr:uncharacterized protein BXZ73DRAFT_41982 [Epithele typhae]KAH9941156.1 hypothetical protein BXZ73DRAFT_41982 [Epithele typhae]